MDIDPVAVKSGFDAIRSALDTIKKLRDQFKGDPENQEELDKSIERAERELQLAEAQIAQALGYELCKAHFPPIPMLSDRVHPKYTDEIFKCPECGRENPSPEHFQKKERIDAAIERHNNNLKGGVW